MIVQIPNRFRNISIMELGFTGRAHHVINRAQIMNFGDFLDRNTELVNYPNCGKTSVHKMSMRMIDWIINHMTEEELKAFTLHFATNNPGIKIAVKEG